MAEDIAPGALPSVTPESIFVGRQPIFDRKQNVYAYELLFRSGEENASNVVSDDLATSLVLSNTFIEIGLERIVGDARAFINCPRSMLLEECHLPPDRVVLELLETIEVDMLLIERCRALKGQGFMLALDDFVPSPAWEPLVPLADVIKLDVLEMSENVLEETVARLPRNVTLLAEKVESLTQYSRLRDLGFHLFQGYFLSRPDIVTGKRVPSSSHTTLRMVAELQRSDITPQDLERLISQDVSLSYKLLRFVNSPATGLATEVESVYHAVFLIGLDSLRHWATLLALTANGSTPLEITRTALTRARMCELLASYGENERLPTYFLVGLLSALEQFLHTPLSEALDGLALPADCIAALLRHEGPLGEALECTLAYEACNWSDAQYRHLSPGALSDVFAAASAWVFTNASELR